MAVPVRFKRLNEETKKNSHKEDRLWWKKVLTPQAEGRKGGREGGRQNKVTEQHLCEDKDKMIMGPH